MLAVNSCRCQRQIGIPSGTTGAELVHVVQNTPPQIPGQVGPRKHIIAKANGLVEVARLNPAARCAEPVDPGLVVQIYGRAAFAQPFFDSGSFGELDSRVLRQTLSS